MVAWRMVVVVVVEVEVDVDVDKEGKSTYKLQYNSSQAKVLFN